MKTRYVKPKRRAPKKVGALARFEQAWKSGQVRKLIAAERALVSAANDRDPKLRQVGREGDS